MTKIENIVTYIRKVYAAKPEYPWKEDPGSAAFRNRRTGRYFAVTKAVSPQRTDQGKTGETEALCVRISADTASRLLPETGCFKKINIGKTDWIMIPLEKDLPEEMVLDAIDWSFDLVDKK